MLKELQKTFPKTLIYKIAGVVSAASVEYLLAELIDLSVGFVKQTKRKSIISRDLNMAIQNDCELQNLLSNVTIA